MIRSDYFMRLVRQLVQTMQRVLFLKERKEYLAALQEIERTLAQFWELSPEQVRQLPLDKWVELCAGESGLGDKLVGLADLFKEQGDLYALEGNPSESARSHALALGLYLETLHSSLVSLDLLRKTENLIELTQEAPLPSQVRQRLVSYYELRGKYAAAEDALFDWLELGEPAAAQSALVFYERMESRSDRDLEEGGLPRPEVREGKQALLRRLGKDLS